MELPFGVRGRIASFARCGAVDSSAQPRRIGFYTSLPDPAPVWRGCERGRERGLSWTTDRKVAAGFARGMRCRNAVPTVQAEIPKRHLFGVFVERNESEVAVDPRRLRKLQRIDEANPLLGTN
jgi:hypothetical protein